MCCIHSECPRVDVYAVAPGQVRHQRPLLRVARALWLAGQSTIKKRNGAEAKPAMDAHKVQMMTVERKRPLVMPPGSELGEEQALPDVNLAMFLRLAAKFNLYAVSLEEVKQRLMRRLSPALQMPKSQMDPYQINLRIEGPWPIQAFQQMLSCRCHAYLMTLRATTQIVMSLATACEWSACGAIRNLVPARTCVAIE